MMHQRRFTKEFEEEAVRQVQSSGRTQREIVPYRAKDRSRRNPVTLMRRGEGPLTSLVPAFRRGRPSVSAHPLHAPSNIDRLLRLASVHVWK